MDVASVPSLELSEATAARLADMKIVEAYVRLVEQECKDQGSKYLDELKAAKDKPIVQAAVPSWTTSSAANVVSEPKRGDRWSGVPHATSLHERAQIARRCTATYLEVFKELEQIRSDLKKAYDRYAKPSEGETVAPPRGTKHRPTTAAGMTPRTAAPVADGMIEVFEDMYASAGRAVETVRGGLLYTSTILNTYVTAKDATATLRNIIQLVEEEIREIDVRCHRNAKDRSEHHLEQLGLRHLGSASDMLQHVPRAPKEIHAWQAALQNPITTAKQEADSTENQSAPLHKDMSRQQLKSVAMERVMLQSKQLCDALNIHITPKPQIVREESFVTQHNSRFMAKRPVRPTTARVPQATQPLSVDGFTSLSAPRPSSARPR